MGLIFLTVFLVQSKQRSKIGDIPETKIDDTEIFKNGGGDINTLQREKENSAKIPSSFLLSVPFASQAPFGDWSQPYQDGCEEASVIMVKHYLQSKPLSKDQMKSEIDTSVKWQEDVWKGHKDLDAQMTLLLAKQYFEINGKVIGVSEDEIKRHVSSGLPVLVPAAGRKLGNPNFTGAGPEYHMLVIIGYDDSKGVFITNDPGTRKGEKYVYKYKTLIDAISGPRENMQKELIVLSGN